MDANEDVTNASEAKLVLKRFYLYFSSPVKLFKNPILGIGMIFMKVSGIQLWCARFN